jgi:hypothetical protein
MPTTPGIAGPQVVDQNNIYLAFSQVCALIVTVTASPQPSYSENGRSVPKSEYLSTLIAQQKTLLQSLQMACGPFELQSVVRGR